MSTQAWTLERSHDFLVLNFDLPGESVNILRHENLDQLEALLEEAASIEGIRGLLIKSGKAENFIAGADIHAIAEVKTAEEGQAASERGQAVFAMIESLPYPTVACIHGACVGGGLELALACRYRLASDARTTRLGLPEVMLGILPGFGGTQRLPRTTGLINALPLLLTGKMLDGRRARRIGLVSDVVARQQLDQRARQILGRPPSRPRRPIFSRIADWAVQRIGPIRSFVLNRARKEVQKKAGSIYPAPANILKAVEAGFRSRASGYATEARLLGELIMTPVSNNLVRLFLLSERAKEIEPVDAPLSKVWVSGSGTMGAGICALFAGHGVRTRIMDPSPEALAAGMATIYESLRQKMRHEPDKSHALTRAMDHVEPSLTMAGLSQCDLFIEVVPEVLELKRRVLSAAEQGLSADALLATNTSSLDLNELGAALRDPARLVGIHFFNPVHRMRLVEIVRHDSTNQRAVLRARKVVKDLGKVPVVVKNCPGFLVNRLLTPYLLAAEQIAAEGVSIELLDRRMKQDGMPMGPFALLDEVGLDVAAHVAETLCAAFPDRFVTHGLLQRLVDAGHLGKKTGRGFYVYEKGKSVNPILARPKVTTAPESSQQEWVERMVLPVVAEAYRCLDEEIVASADEVDLAMMLGTGFLLPSGGPMQFAKQRGVDQIISKLKRLEQEHGACYAVPQSLAARNSNHQEALS